MKKNNTTSQQQTTVKFDNIALGSPHNESELPCTKLLRESTYEYWAKYLYKTLYKYCITFEAM